MNEKPISNITIVGGGTAGWLAAGLLSTFFRRPDGTPGVDISLIESPDIQTVGVGEATVPAMPRTLEQIGISEAEVMTRCNATFKLAVRFSDWDRDENNQPVEFLNSFDTDPPLQGRNLAAYYTRFGAQRNSAHAGHEFASCYSPVPDLIAQRKGPRPTGLEEYAGSGTFAYHLDAGLFAGLLQEFTVARGVRHIRENVQDVEIDERGFVNALQLEQSGRHPVELVIDCTGFRGLVINKALGEEFVSYGKYLMNDRAMALRIPHDDPTRLDPCTSSTALGAGWVWRVPLYSRLGTGYVYSSKFRSDDEAMTEYMDHLGPAAKGLEPRVIPLRVGQSRRAWVKNCVAMGLASGFIEPLESTAIYSIEMAIRMLFSYFPDTGFDPALAQRYNKKITAFHEEIRDFIVLHYALGNRTDSPYWVTAREDMEIPDSLRENPNIWRHNLPGPHDLDSTQLFGHDTYIMVLIAKGFYRDRPLNNGATVDQAVWDQFIQTMQPDIARMVAAMPSHYDLVTSIRTDGGKYMADEDSGGIL
jgi:tryptophan 6-halogenase